MVKYPTSAHEQANIFTTLNPSAYREVEGMPIQRLYMEKTSIELPGTTKYGPYSAGVEAGGMVWLSGQIAVEEGDDVKSQTQGSLDKIDALLDAAGISKHNICFAQILLADINDFTSINEVYGAWVKDMQVKPARAAFAAAALPAGALVEIVVQAMR
jgi:2-iminobutanoate/2-iminopropanoate deaminase